jgi:hypothetical protein
MHLEIDFPEVAEVIEDVLLGSTIPIGRTNAAPRSK